jgi:hypothetical protein
VDLPPNFFPYTSSPKTAIGARATLNSTIPANTITVASGPFIAGFYVAALVAAKRYTLAEEKLVALTKLVTLSSNGELAFGFNEWIKAQDGQTKGQDWQTWSAALYLYAAKCVEERKTPFFDTMRK